MKAFIALALMVSFALEFPALADERKGVSETNDLAKKAEANKKLNGAEEKINHTENLKKKANHKASSPEVGK